MNQYAARRPDRRQLRSEVTPVKELMVAVGASEVVGLPFQVMPVEATRAYMTCAFCGPVAQGVLAASSRTMSATL